MTRSILLALVVLGGCADVGGARAPVVYGTDDRLEVYEAAAGPHRSIAESAVAMQIGIEWVDPSNPADVRITYDQTLGEAHSLCTDVRYQEQIEPGTCSGTLIDEQHLLTAGHCVAAAEDCDGVSWPWIFGFYYEAAGRLRTLTAEDVYFCERTVVLRNDDVADYAVIELDRPVVGHTPARVRRAPDAPIGTPLTLIGHPNGISMKIAGNATLRGVSGIELYADVDAFFGNSGSGTFDDAGEVVGILVAGAPIDYRVRPGSGGCSEIEVIDPVPPGEGETLTAVAAPVDAFCATTAGAGSPVCGAAPSDAGTRDASTADAGESTPDAGANAPDATVADAGTAAPASGCGCSAARAPASPTALLCLLALALLRRRAR